MTNDPKGTKRTPAKATKVSAPVPAPRKAPAKAAPAKATKATPAKAPAAVAKATPAKKAPAKKAPAARQAVATPAGPPADWYVLGDGSSAYWDGAAWSQGPDDSGPEPEQPAADGKGKKTPGPEDVITFHGRDIEITMPDQNQIAVWGRVARQASGLGNGMKAHDASKLLGRLLGVVSSVLVNERDRDWLEDELLEKRMTMNEAGGLVTEAIDHFVAKRKAKAPTTGPTAAKQARRR